MKAAMIRNFRACWKGLVLTDVLLKVIAFVLLTPFAGLLFRLFVALSGRTVLVDVDIASFLLHPLGWICLIVVGGATLGILALEQAALMAIAAAAGAGERLPVRQALRFSLRNARAVFGLTSRTVAWLLLLAAPFLAIGGGLYLALLTGHDINYFLTKKPPVYWVAAALIGVVLAALVAVLFRSLVAWSFALPLVLFEGVPARAALRGSRDRTAGRRMHISVCVAAWFAANFLLTAAVTGLVALLGRWALAVASGSLWLLSLTVGAVLLFGAVLNFVGTLVGTTTFAVLLVNLYIASRAGGGPPVIAGTRLREDPSAGTLSAEEGAWLAFLFRLSRRRLIALLAVACLVSALIGAVSIHSLDIQDHAQITAHRGASGSAPENTLAAFRQAIADEADWVELDVQESRDGVVVVAHDSDLKKVAGTDAKFWEATADELRSIDIGSYFDPRFKAERVPLLAEVLEACRGKIRVNIELKYYGHDQNLEQKVIELVEAAGMQSDVVIMSLKAEGIRKVKALRPTWTVGLLAAVAAGDLTRANADFLAVNAGLANKAFIRSAHRRGKQVLVWTVNDKAAMSTLIGRGVDGIITDHPALARSVLAERAQLSPFERLLLELALMFGSTPPEASADERP